MSTIATLPQRRTFDALEKRLQVKCNEVSSRLQEHRFDVYVEQEPDDIGAEATRNIAKDLAISTLERDRRTLEEIEAALDHFKKGDYGFCEQCGAQIPEVRLRALPWTELCIRCAEP